MAASARLLVDDDGVGEQFVAQLVLPPFRTRPDVIVWGHRVFVWRFDQDNSHCYVEVCAWWASVTSGEGSFASGAQA